MKFLTCLFAWLALVSAASAGVWETQQVYLASGTDDVPLVGYSQSGASACEFNQDTHFNSPSLLVLRSGTAGGEIATSPIVLIQGAAEMTGSTGLLQMGGCTGLSGDNWITFWGYAAVSIPLGVGDGVSKLVPGFLSVDPVHRQLVGEDGLTGLLKWTGGAVTIKPRSTAPSSPGEGAIYYDLPSHHFFGWNGTAWKQLDN